MDNLINKYGFIVDKLFNSEDSVIESKINFTEDRVEIPEPSEYRISTMTMITSFNCNINLSVVNQYFETDKIIVSMVYGDKPVKSSCMKKKNNRPFFNQATIIVKLDPLKKINVKIFSNGKIQMTGVKKEEEGKHALELILKKLFITEGKVPISKLLLTQQISMLQEKLGTEKLPDYYLMFPAKPPKKSAWHKYNVTPEMELEEAEKVRMQKIQDKKDFGNTFQKKIDINSILENDSRENIEKIVNIKRVYEDLISFYNNEDIDIYALAIEDKLRIKIMPINTVLINSDFNINFKIKRNILHSILKDKYGVVSRYEPGIYPGVNNKYYWNLNNKGTETDGKCICHKDCSGKGDGDGDGNCKKITIAAFQSGSIIITGARTIEHIEDAYKFINRVIKDNYDLIRKIETPFMDIESSSKKNKPKKYIKTSDILYIKKESLLNKYNSPETLEKFKKHSNITSLHLP